MSRRILVASVALLALVGLVVFAVSGVFSADGAGVQGAAESSDLGGSLSTPLGSGAAGQTAGASAMGSSRLPSHAPDAAAAWVDIPSIGLRHALQAQGLSPTGTVSPEAGQVIWFTGFDRVKPGALGTAVVAGHVEANGHPDAFATLSRAKRRDRVRIGYADGRVLTLAIVGTETVDKTQLQTSPDVWGSQSSIPRVVLITCDSALGRRADGHFAANFVAIAEPVAPEGRPAIPICTVGVT